MILIAMDRAASVRRLDVDGRLHIETSPISKANVCPYYGREIPRWRELGLEPDRIYKLLRDPEELAKGAPTFNNVQVLSEHVPVTAWTDESHMAKLTVGSTGTDAEFSDPYLTNSLVIWAKPSIDGILSDQKRELSAAYHFTADMTSGVFDGVAYNGIMRDIRANHVALVIDGRAGPDVMVGDEKPMAFRSKRALMLAGGLTSRLRPLLAQDSALDLSAALGATTDKSLKTPAARRALGEQVFGLVQPMLAQDAELDVDDVCKVIDAVQGVPLSEDDSIMAPEAPAMSKVGADEEGGEGAAVARLLNYLKGKLSDEDYTAAAALVQAEEAMDGDDGDNDEDDKPAMDAASIRRAAAADFAAIRTAEREVRPVIGELAVAMDSAAAIYKEALVSLGVDLAGLPEASYGATFRAVQSARAAVASPTVAQDAKNVAASRSAFETRFPKRTNLIRG